MSSKRGQQPRHPFYLRPLLGMAAVASGAYSPAQNQALYDAHRPVMDRGWIETSEHQLHQLNQEPQYPWKNSLFQYAANNPREQYELDKAIWDAASFARKMKEALPTITGHNARTENAESLMERFSKLNSNLVIMREILEKFNLHPAYKTPSDKIEMLSNVVGISVRYREAEVDVLENLARIENNKIMRDEEISEKFRNKLHELRRELGEAKAANSNLEPLLEKLKALRKETQTSEISRKDLEKIGRECDDLAGAYKINSENYRYLVSTIMVAIGGLVAGTGGLVVAALERKKTAQAIQEHNIKHLKRFEENYAKQARNNKNTSDANERQDTEYMIISNEEKRRQREEDAMRRAEEEQAATQKKEIQRIHEQKISDIVDNHNRWVNRQIEEDKIKEDEDRLRRLKEQKEKREEIVRKEKEKAQQEKQDRYIGKGAPPAPPKGKGKGDKAKAGGNDSGYYEQKGKGVNGKKDGTGTDPNVLQLVRTGNDFNLEPRTADTLIKSLTTTEDPGLIKNLEGRMSFLLGNVIIPIVNAMYLRRCKGGNNTPWLEGYTAVTHDFQRFIKNYGRNRNSFVDEQNQDYFAEDVKLNILILREQQEKARKQIIKVKEEMNDKIKKDPKRFYIKILQEKDKELYFNSNELLERTSEQTNKYGNHGLYQVVDEAVKAALNSEFYNNPVDKKNFIVDVLSVLDKFYQAVIDLSTNDNSNQKAHRHLQRKYVLLSINPTPENKPCSEVLTHWEHYNNNTSDMLKTVEIGVSRGNVPGRELGLLNMSYNPKYSDFDFLFNSLKEQINEKRRQNRLKEHQLHKPKKTTRKQEPIRNAFNVLYGLEGRLPIEDRELLVLVVALRKAKELPFCFMEFKQVLTDCIKNQGTHYFSQHGQLGNNFFLICSKIEENTDLKMSLHAIEQLSVSCNAWIMTFKTILTEKIDIVYFDTIQKLEEDKRPTFFDMLEKIKNFNISVDYVPEIEESIKNIESETCEYIANLIGTGYNKSKYYNKLFKAALKSEKYSIQDSDLKNVFVAYKDIMIALTIITKVLNSRFMHVCTTSYPQHNSQE